MNKLITVVDASDSGEVKVREVVTAAIGIGFLPAPRPDIAVGDVLTEQEQMVCGLIPWPEPSEPTEPPLPEPLPAVESP